MNAHAQTSVASARREYDLAHYGDASSDARLDALHNLMAAEQAADPALKARRMRTKAQDLRHAYGRHMEAYGQDIGRATRRAAQNETTLATLAESAAQASLILASECLTEALALEAEADANEAGSFIVLFDGVSARSGADVLAILQGA